MLDTSVLNVSRLNCSLLNSGDTDDAANPANLEKDLDDLKVKVTEQEAEIGKLKIEMRVLKEQFAKMAKKWRTWYNAWSVFVKFVFLKKTSLYM